MQSISPTMCLKGRTVIDDYVFLFSKVCFTCLLLRKSFYSTIAHPRPHVAELGPNNRVNWVFITKPVLSAAIYDTTFNTLEDVPTKQCNGLC